MRFLQFRYSMWLFLFFFYWCRVHLELHSFPTRRSSDLGGQPSSVTFMRRSIARRAASSHNFWTFDQRGHLDCHAVRRSEEHTSELQVTWPSRMPSSA